MTSQRLPELPDLTVIEPTFEGPGSQTMAPAQHLPVPPEDPAGMDSIHRPAPRHQQKPVTPSPPPQPPDPTLPLRRVKALGIPDLLALLPPPDLSRGYPLFRVRQRGRGGCSGMRRPSVGISQRILPLAEGDA
jgi:hypothetical protein